MTQYLDKVKFDFAKTKSPFDNIKKQKRQE